MSATYFIPEARIIPLEGERKKSYSYHLAELIPFYSGNNISTTVPIDRVKYPAGDIYRSGTYSGGVWTLDWGVPWDTNQWVTTSHELVDSFGERFPITANTQNALTVSGGSPIDGRAFISPAKIYLDSTIGFSNGIGYAFAPGSRIRKAIAITPVAGNPMKVKVFGVGGLSSNPWRQNEFNKNPSGFSKYLLIDSDRNLFKITDTKTLTANWNHPNYYATLTLTGAKGVSESPVKGPALILDSAGYLEYNGRSSDSKGEYLNSVNVFGSFIAGNSTIIGAPFESRKESGENMQVGWLGATTDVTSPSNRVGMASRLKIVLLNGSSSAWVGDFVDTTSSPVVLINDPLPEDVTMRKPEEIEGWEDDPDHDENTKSDVEVRHQFILENTYDPGVGVAAYLWWAVPVGYSADIEIPFSNDTNKSPYWIPDYNSLYEIYLQVIGVNGAKTNSVKVNGEQPIEIKGRSTAFDWGDPTEDVVDFDNYNRAVGTLASFNFDGDPEDILATPGTAGIALNFSTGRAAFLDVIIRGTVYAELGKIGGWIMDGTSIYDVNRFMELNSTNLQLRVNDTAGFAGIDRFIAGKIGSDYGMQINDNTGAELLGIYGSTTNVFGWTATTSALYKDAGSNSVGMSTASSIAYWAGDVYANRATAPYRVKNDGQIEVGGATSYIIIDGPDEEIRNSLYASGTSGWRIMSAGGGTAEFNDIIARGTISANTIVFQESAVTRGTILVTYSAGELWSSFTAGGTNTIYISKTPSTESSKPFQQNDICLLNNGFKKSWIKINSAGTSNTGNWSYATTSLNDPTSGFTYPAGSAVADYGPSGKGGIEITADKSAAPYIDIFVHSGSPWSSVTSVGRIGKMDGYHGISGEAYGFGFGNYPGGSYIHYDHISEELVYAGSVTILNPADQDNVKVFYQNTAPNAIHVGDLWFDTSTIFEVLYSAVGLPADEIKAGEWEVVDRDAIRTFRMGPSVPTSIHIGDLWYDTSDTNRLYVAASVGATTKGSGQWEAVDQPGIKIFWQGSIPTSLRAGDLWYHTGQNYRLYVAMIAGANEIIGGEWEVAQDDLFISAFLAAGNAQAAADGEIIGWYSAGNPGDKEFGDIWIDTTGGFPDSNDIYRFEDSSGGSQGTLAWRAAYTNAIGIAYLEAYDARIVADGKIATFYQDSTPIPVGDEGDFWVRTDLGNRLYRAMSDESNEITAGEWVEIQDTDIFDAFTAAGNAQAAADGEIVGWYSAGNPGDKEFGDIWIDTTGGNPDSNDIYRFEDSSGGSQGTLAWRAAYTNAIGVAYLTAYDARIVADGKIVTFYQDSTPIPVGMEGDLWVRTDLGKKLYRAMSDWSDAITGGEWEEVQDDGIDEARETAIWNPASIDGLGEALYNFNNPSGAAGFHLNPTWGMGFWDGSVYRAYIGNTGNFYLGSGAKGNALAYYADSGLLMMGSTVDDVNNRIEISSVDHNMIFYKYTGGQHVEIIRLDDNIFEESSPGIKISNGGIFLMENYANQTYSGVHVLLLKQSTAKGGISGLVGSSLDADNAVYLNVGLSGVKGVGWSSYESSQGGYLTPVAGVQGYGVQEGTGKVAYGVYGSCAAITGATAYGVYGTINTGQSNAQGGTLWAGYFEGQTKINYGLTVTTYGLGVGTAIPTTAGLIRATNNVVAYYSDRRLKDIEGPIEDSIEKILQLTGVYYKENKLAEKFGYKDKSRKVGIIAQEVAKVLPEAVALAPFDVDANGESISGENYLTIQYEKLIPLLVEGMKAQQAEIKELKELIKA